MPFPYSNSRMFPSNHKTVFVLDHTPYFGISCESPIEFEFLKGRTPGFIPASPISKSLWTCGVEAAVEYCRIVWDLFPHGKLVRFIASDAVAHIMSTWNPLQQNLNYIINGMSVIGIPPLTLHRTHPSQDYSIVHGLRAAVEVLGECTDLQIEKQKTSKFVNRGRVICITSARDDESMKRLQEIFNNYLHIHNSSLDASERHLPVDHCHLVLLNTFPVNVDSIVTNQAPRNVSSILTTEVHAMKATLISNTLSFLILQHYELASTTVTGIPMKEEQNASSSANYDVEIYHSKEVHTALLKANASDSSHICTMKEGLGYETITLRWCTPRGCAASELQNCTNMYRITPVEVNSRPSLCLINFLLNGRSVLLEMPKRNGGKINSHLLASHGGEIFIHTLCTARSVLEDPPSISEGCGGRVTDYRITDFGLLIQYNRLVPIKPNYVSDVPTSIAKMKARLNRHTKYWPLTISSTLIFNLKNYIEPIPTIITKERITEEEVVQCKQVIYNLIALETKHEPLHLPNVGSRTKGQKREEQYKIMWNELETLLKNNCHTDNHKAVYECLTECHQFNFEDDKVELDQALRELDQMDSQRASVIRATTDSPMSPPPLASIAAPVFKQRQSKGDGIYSTPRSLYDIFISQDKGISRADFAGETTDGTMAKLYPNLNVDNERDRSRGEAMEVN